MSGRGELVPLDPDDPEHVGAAAHLHATLLGHSPVPRLGMRFMTRFFYSRLVADGLVRCYLYRVEGQYVGFLSLTERPDSFMRQGTRRHLVRLAAVLAASLAEKPSRVGILWETLAASRRKQHASPRDAVGELLSFGVLPGFAARRESNGLRIPTILFDAGIRHFRERGFRRIEWTVDRDNLPAMILYRSYGAVLDKSADAWPGDYRVRLEL